MSDVDTKKVVGILTDYTEKELEDRDGIVYKLDVREGEETNRYSTFDTTTVVEIDAGDRGAVIRFIAERNGDYWNIQNDSLTVLVEAPEDAVQQRELTGVDLQSAVKSVAKVFEGCAPLSEREYRQYRELIGEAVYLFQFEELPKPSDEIEQTFENGGGSNA